MKALTIVGVLVVSCLFFVELRAQEPAVSRIAILPFHSNGVDSVSVQTSESILRTEIGKLSGMDIISEKRTTEALEGTPCIESECALEVGKKLGATQVLGCKLSALGERIIAQYFLVEVATSRQLVIDQSTAANVEDLEVMMKRIARSAVDRAPIDKNVEVGKILVSESNEPLRRASRKNFGISFGYMYPQHGYDNSDRIFVADARFDYELQDYSVGMLFGIRKGFAMNLYGAYLFSKTDLCPYAGGAFGFHWVSHDDRITYFGVPAGSYTVNQTNPRSDGFELTGNAGIRVLHTYNFQLIFNLEYIYTLNGFDDGAVVFTIGIL